MWKTVRKTTSGAWTAAIVLAVIVLRVSGAEASQRPVSASEDFRKSTENAVEGAAVRPVSPLPDEASDNVATGGKPFSEQQAYLTAPLITKPDKSENRHKHGSNCRSGLHPSHFDVGDSSSLRTTAFLVSSSLGVQFTLLGAKPSGTS